MVLKGRNPLPVRGDVSPVRHYTYRGDLAKGIRLAMESPRAVYDDFNLSTAESTTVRELADAIWHKVYGDLTPLRLVSDPPYEHDVQRRVADRRKAPEGVGFETTTPPEAMLDEVVPWIPEGTE